jgi:Spy/CpxP family protein refolding chaperone
MQKLFITLSLLVFTTLCIAQKAPDSLSAASRSLGYEQYKAYFAGTDINKLDAIAELNGYPSPQKALSLKKELGLSADQVAQLTAITTELKRKMKEMGALIIRNEETLNTLFKTKQINDGNLIFYANRYGGDIGELRNAMLQTYLKTQNILTPEQLKKYSALPKP